jgi:diguanylate cyclase (GGDEF)-like protein/PAS domain S-box-containing protein
MPSHDQPAPGTAKLPESFLSSALDSVDEAVIITDLGGVVAYWNEAASTLYGYTAAETRGRRLIDLILPVESRSAGEAVIRDVVKGATQYQGEWLMQDRSGRRFSVLVTTSPILDAAGKPSHLIGTSSENSSQKLAFRTAQTLATIVATSSDSIMTADPSGVVVWANPSTEAVFGWTAQDLVGQHISVLVPVDQRDEQQILYRRLLSGDPVPPTVTHRLRRDGTELTVSLSLGLVRDEAGVLLATSCIARDLTGQVKLQRDVVRQEARFRAGFDQASMPQSVLDLSGHHLQVNDAYCRLLDWSREELLQRDMADLAHESDRGAGATGLALVTGRRQSSARYETILARSGGAPIPVLMDVTMIMTDGEPSGLASFLSDLTAVRAAEARLAKQRTLFDALSRRATDVAIVSDLAGDITYVSPSVIEIFGYHPQAILGLAARDFVHPDHKATVEDALERVRAVDGGVERLTIQIRDAEGEWRWVDETVTNCLADPDIDGLVTNLRDVTEQVRTQEELRRSEARYRAIAETAQEGIFVLGPSGAPLYANQKLAEILGLSLEKTYRAGLSALVTGADADGRAPSQRRRVVGVETHDRPYPHPDGTDRVLCLSSSPMPIDTADDDRGDVAEAGPAVGSLTMVSDVTDARRAERELRHQALHDALTGLPNRALLTDRLGTAVARQKRSGTGPLAVIFLDLDQFKMINDTRGHDAGDLLLCEVAARLAEAVRADDTLARVGGDEFAVLCEDADTATALAVAERLRDCLGDAVEIDGQRFYVDASIGVALSPPLDADALLRSADAAMYEAKSDGRGRIRTFDATLVTSADRRLRVMTALGDAFAADRVELLYEPVVDVETGALRGVEALLGWTDVALGPLSEAEIAGAAEATGLSSRLDTWLLGRACADMSGLRARGLLPEAYLSVRVSARSVSSTSLDAVVAATLDSSGWPADRLVVEVTEAALMSDPGAAARLFTRLREHGVSIAVGDFGTGYSSLASLKRLPISILKIDRSFVDTVDADPDSLSIVDSIVHLAQALGLRTEAAGLATAHQATTMHGLGCSIGRGPLWSPPVTLDGLIAYAAKTRDASGLRGG